MTYANLDTSLDSGTPFYLYLFTQGASNYYYTSVEATVSFGGNSYVPAPMQSDKIVQSNQLERMTLPVRMPRSHALATVLSNSANASGPMNLTLYRAHDIEAPVTQVAFKGRLTSTAINGQILEANFEALNSLMKRNGLRARYQKPCRHILYSQSCGADINNFQTQVTVSSISGRDVTVSSHGQSSDYYVGGIFEYSGQLYTIMDQSGDTLTLKKVPETLSVNDPVNIYAGCPLNINTCSSRFNNAVNFGGFPYTPKDNPANGFSGISIF